MQRTNPIEVEIPHNFPAARSVRFQGLLMFHLTCFLGRLTSSVQRVMTSAARPIVIFVLGGPGAGKGTQCERIVKVKKLTCG